VQKFLFKKQGGNFTVEFAMVGVFFSLLLAFSGDIIIKLSIKGKLDRMAYSAATIIAERTQLFDDTYIIDEASTGEGSKSYQIVLGSLTRTISSFDEDKFGYELDQITYDTSGTTQSPIFKKGIACDLSNPSSDMLITTSWGRSLTLYQVTLCYTTDNWFGGLLGKNYSRVQSYAIAIGR
jgi:tight adherence protein F